MTYEDRISASWFLQDAAERRRRLAVVMQLSVELARIREEPLFAGPVEDLNGDEMTSVQFAAQAVESVIEGDREMIAMGAEYFEQAHVAVFATFRAILLQALRPGTEAPA